MRDGESTGRDASHGDNKSSFDEGEIAIFSEPAYQGNDDSTELSSLVAKQPFSLEMPSQCSSPFGPIRIDDCLCSFDAFRNHFWLSPSGQVEDASWTDREAFSQEIKKALDTALECHDFGRTFLFIQVLDTLEHSKDWDLDDWMCAEAITESPASISAGASSSRASRLLNVLQDEQSGLDMRLPIFLELLRPDMELGISMRLERHLERPFHDADLREVVSYLVWGQTVSVDAFGIITAQLKHGGGMTRAEFEQELDKHSRELRTRVNELRNAAGRNIQQTHSRNAWKRFMDEIIQPLYDKVLSTDGPKQKLLQDLPQLRLDLRRMRKSYAQIMDDGNVKLHDRRVADRRADELELGFTKILDGLEKFNSFGDSRAPKQVPIESARRLLERNNRCDPVEELCRQIFQCLAGNPPQKYPLRLNTHILLDTPALLGELKPDALKNSHDIDHGLPIDFFRPPFLGTAALLAKQPASTPDSHLSVEEQLLSRVRERALEAYRERPDLLSYLFSVPRLLESSDINRLHRLASDHGDKVFQAAQDLTVLAWQCQDLLSTNHKILCSAVESVRSLADKGITSAGLTDGLLLMEWINRLKTVCERDKAAAIASYEAAIRSQSPELLDKLNSALKSGDFRKVPLLQSGDIPSVESGHPAWRRTPWRTLDLVRNTGSHLIQDLYKVREEGSDEIRELVDLWTTPPENSRTKQKFRRLFYRWISGEEGIGVARRKRIFPEGLVRGFDSTSIHIQCRTIRKIFRKEGLNPTFLPQLADYADIVLLSHPSTSFRGDGIATDWGKSVTAEGNNSLVVFLAPKLPELRRAEILSAFRNRNLSAAIIDDFDFWRLATVDDSLGHDFVPFLEIVMEQLRLEKVSPFSNQDGQHVRLETYVGRQEAAEKLAKTAHYSRVFSGRKLGKSALLKQVEVVYDNSELPSGNRLNVLFVTIAGGDSEAWIVDQIVGDMSKRFDLSAESLPEGSPSDRFRHFIERFVNQRPTDSLLIILDEADQFVEGQLENYDRDRENSLSFRMMKELPTWTDNHGLPRVRVILSGYRVTHTREGVWANAGDVLRLVPLQEAEAIQFIQGALARIGVDIAEHAVFIARRCGFQPAILIRFGQSLLSRLQNRRASQQNMGECISVSPADVAETFNDSLIIEEIRTVVSNNFQGNRVGGVIFDALLLAMQELPPGFPLREAPQKILEKIREIEPDLGWLTRIDPTPESEIKRNLRDFIERELLIDDGDAYRLRFPHYLPILTQQRELPLTIRQRIRALMQAPSVRRRGGSILAEQSLDRIRYWYDQDKIELCRLVAVGGGWITALNHPKVGVADRLGCNRAQLHDGHDGFAAAINRARVFSGLSEDDCAELGKQVTQPAVVLGGINILRWALRQEGEGSDLLIETVPIQRITRANISWWFEGARALHFESPNAVTRIADITGGIPFLLEKLDTMLAAQDGSDVTSDALAQVCQEFKTKLSVFTEDLRSGPPSVRLTVREIELMKMLIEIAGQGLSTGPGTDFCENWELCEHDASFLPPYANDEDDLALRTLIAAGILALDDQKKFRIGADSVESHIVQTWHEHAHP